MPLLSLAPEPTGGVKEDGGEELPVIPTAALIQMLVRVFTLSLNRRRIGSLQSRNESSDDAELLVDGDAVFDSRLLGLGQSTGSGDVGDGGSSSRYYHRRSVGLLMDA